MSEFNPEIWWGLGVAVAGGLATALGFAHGGQRREDTRQRVTGLALGGAAWSVGQVMLTQQNVTDMLRLGRDLVEAVREQTKATIRLAESVEGLDETTEREAHDRTAGKLDALNEAVRALRKDGG